MTSPRQRTGHLHLLYVSYERNLGWPSRREPKGHGAAIVLVGVTPDQGAPESGVQGKARKASTGGERRLARDALTNRPQRLLETGEPCAWKACKHGSGRGGWKRTRESNALAAYFTSMLENALNASS